MNYDWDFTHIWREFDSYLAGGVVTLFLTASCCITGTLGGLILALVLRIHKIIGVPLATMMFVLRGVPELVLLFAFYFFPYQELLGIPPPPSIWCAYFAFSLGLTIFTAGLFDSALRQIPENQMLGATSLGLTRIEILRFVLIPNLVRLTLPGLLAFWISILKLTCLASVIGVRDLVYVARIGMSENARALEAWLIVAGMYILLVLPLSIFARRVESLPWLRHQ